MFSNRYVISLVLLPLIVSAFCSAETPFRFPEGKEGKGQLKYINDLPVAYVEGTPEEIGKQLGRLVVKPGARLLDYPKDYLRKQDRAASWPQIIAIGKGMLPNFPKDHLQELEATVKVTGLDRDLFVAANTMFDMQKPIGCSALMIEPARSATGGPLFGLNLDFPTLGYLHEYSLVTVC